MLEEVKKTVRRKGKLEQETLEAIIRAFGGLRRARQSLHLYDELA